MVQKKKIQEEQPAVSGTTKTKSKKTKTKAPKGVGEIPQEESELIIEEDTSFLSVENDSPLAKDYSIEELFAALDEPDENNNEEKSVSDDILDKFDKDLEAKGLGEGYFLNKEKRLKEMELEHELHEFAINKMLNEEN